MFTKVFAEYEARIAALEAEVAERNMLLNESGKLLSWMAIHADEVHSAAAAIRVAEIDRLLSEDKG